MKKQIGFYKDAQKLGDWDWERFLSGDIGMSGTDGQLLLLVNDLATIYKVYFFTNIDAKPYKNIETIKVNDLEDAAIQVKNLSINLLIFNNRGDENTVKGIRKLEELDQPFILWDHNGPTEKFENILTNVNALKRIVCVSKTHANWHRHRGFFPKVTYIYNGKDYWDTGKKAAIQNNKHSIGYLGAVSEGKGFQWVAKAWPDIRKKIPDATLTVIGSIKTHDRTRETGDLGIGIPEFENKYIKPYLGKDIKEITSNGINFTGHISPNEMAAYMHQLSLGIVNPNMNGSNETFCVSAIDFQAYDVPVIGANTGGLKETINNNKTGLLIDDSDKLADAVIKLFNDPKQLEFLKTNCNQWVKDNFSRKQIVGAWQNLIEDVLNNKSNRVVSFNLKDINVKLLAKELVRIKNKFTR